MSHTKYRKVHHAERIHVQRKVCVAGKIINNGEHEAMELKS